MRKLVLGLWLAGWSVLCISASAATTYVSDQFTVPLRRGPSNSYKILNAGLPSGMPLEVLSVDSAAGFTKAGSKLSISPRSPSPATSSQLPIAGSRRSKRS